MDTNNLSLEHNNKQDNWIRCFSHRIFTAYWININNGQLTSIDPRNMDITTILPVDPDSDVNEFNTVKRRILDYLFPQTLSKRKDHLSESQLVNDLNEISSSPKNHNLVANVIFVIVEKNLLVHSNYSTLMTLLRRLKNEIVNSIRTVFNDNITVTYIAKYLEANDHFENTTISPQNENKIDFYNLLLRSGIILFFVSEMNQKIDFVIDSLINKNRILDYNAYDKAKLKEYIMEITSVAKYKKSSILGYSFKIVQTRLTILSQCPDLNKEYQYYVCTLIETIYTAKLNNNVVNSNLQRSQLVTEYPKYAVILLLGEPGVGKSNLGRFLVDNKRASSFTDIGSMLRSRGHLDSFQRISIGPRKLLQFQSALDLLIISISDYMKSDGILPLIVTFVKEPRDVYVYLETVKNAARLHSRDVSTTISWFLQSASKSTLLGNNVHNSLHRKSIKTNEELIEEKRKLKWMKGESSIIDILKSTGCFYELSPVGSTQSYHWVFKSNNPSSVPWPYIENCNTKRQNILSDMKCILGLSVLLPLVTHQLKNHSDLFSLEIFYKWLLYPGRYSMTKQSNNKESTMYFLYISDEGECWLVDKNLKVFYVSYNKLNDSSIMAVCEAFSIASIKNPSLESLLIGSIFHGELVSTTEGGYLFLVSDIVSYQKKRVWQWPLSDRVLLLETEIFNIQDSINLNSMKVLLKKRYPVSSKNILSILKKQSLYPNSFILFSCNLPYDFGNSPTSVFLSWQQIDSFMKFLMEVEDMENNIKNDIKTDIISSGLLTHPARNIDFKTIYESVNILVQKGSVELHLDESTGLEIYSYTAHGKSYQKELEDICRGLILHPDSQTVVTTPFVRFFKPENQDIEKLRDDRIVRASPKYDGSLIIAFWWKGQLMASTRRRMNSEQAQWATNCLRGSQQVVNEFKVGWTYLLELVGGDNRHVVDYPFEQSLVLLSVYDHNGFELDHLERIEIAKRSNLLITPYLYGPLKEFHNFINNNKCHEVNGSFEGWVIEDPDNSIRFKLINPKRDSSSSCSMELYEDESVR